MQRALAHRGCRSTDGSGSSAHGNDSPTDRNKHRRSTDRNLPSAHRNKQSGPTDRDKYRGAAHEYKHADASAADRHRDRHILAAHSNQDSRDRHAQTNPETYRKTRARQIFLCDMEYGYGI